jgi:hypothetical protein
MKTVKKEHHVCQAMDGEGYGCGQPAIGKFNYHGNPELTDWISWVWVWLCERCATRSDRMKDKNEYPKTGKPNKYALDRIKNMKTYGSDYPCFYEPRKGDKK